jgi:hypothetical protein
MLNNFIKKLDFAEIYDNNGTLFVVQHKSMKMSNAKNIKIKFNRMLNLYEISGSFLNKIMVCENNNNEQTDLFIGKAEEDLEINEDLIRELNNQQEIFKLIDVKPKDLYIQPIKIELSDDYEYDLMLKKGFYNEKKLKDKTIYSSSLIIK